MGTAKRVMMIDKHLEHMKKQSGAEQSRAEQGRAEQERAEVEGSSDDDDETGWN